MATKFKTKSVCHPSASLSLSSSLVRTLFFPPVYFPSLWLFLATTICSTRPQEETTHMTFGLWKGKKDEDKQRKEATPRKKRRKAKRRPLAVCFNSCVWCTQLNVTTLISWWEYEKHGAVSRQVLSFSFLDCNASSGQHSLSALKWFH